MNRKKLLLHKFYWQDFFVQHRQWTHTNIHHSKKWPTIKWLNIMAEVEAKILTSPTHLSSVILATSISLDKVDQLLHCRWFQHICMCIQSGWSVQMHAWSRSCYSAGYGSRYSAWCIGSCCSAEYRSACIRSAHSVARCTLSNNRSDFAHYSLILHINCDFWLCTNNRKIYLKNELTTILFEVLLVMTYSNERGEIGEREREEIGRGRGRERVKVEELRIDRP